jgi:hypothetical protein
LIAQQIAAESALFCTAALAESLPAAGHLTLPADMADTASLLALF